MLLFKKLFLKHYERITVKMIKVYTFYHCLRVDYVVIGFDLEVKPLGTHNAA